MQNRSKPPLEFPSPPSDRATWWAAGGSCKQQDELVEQGFVSDQLPGSGPSLSRICVSPMPTALITPEALFEQPGPHVDRLLEAGFEVRYPEDSTFTRGRPPAETIAGLEGVDAILAGGEKLREHINVFQ